MMMNYWMFHFWFSVDAQQMRQSNCNGEISSRFTHKTQKGRLPTSSIASEDSWLEARFLISCRRNFHALFAFALFLKSSERGENCVDLFRRKKQYNSQPGIVDCVCNAWKVCRDASRILEMFENCWKFWFTVHKRKKILKIIFTCAHLVGEQRFVYNFKHNPTGT